MPECRTLNPKNFFVIYRRRFSDGPLKNISSPSQLAEHGFRIFMTNLWVGLNEKNGALRIGEGPKDIGPTAQKCRKRSASRELTWVKWLFSDCSLVEKYKPCLDDILSGASLPKTKQSIKVIWDRKQVGFTWVWRRQMVFWALRTGGGNGGGGEQLLHNQPLSLPPVFNCCWDCDQVWSIINNCIAYI